MKRNNFFIGLFAKMMVLLLTFSIFLACESGTRTSGESGSEMGSDTTADTTQMRDTY